MKDKTCRPCFSCGSEAGYWMDENCDRCIKSSHLKINKTKTHSEYTKSRCRIYDDIITQWMGNGNEPVSLKTYHATQRVKCPYIVTEYPKRKRKDNDKSLTIAFEL